jgi:DNA sulfur modification protein DndE
MPVIRHLEISRFKSTEDANRQLSALSRASSWPDHVITRLAVARSLREPTEPPEVPRERKGGKELRGETFFRSTQDSAFLPWCAAMIAEHAKRAFRDDNDAFDLVIAHWHRGLTLLEEDLSRAGGDFNAFLLGLARWAAELAASTGAGSASPGAAPLTELRYGIIRPITIPIGRVSPAVEPVTVTLNDTRKHSNCHIAISGMSGSGKTQLAMQMLASMAKAVEATTGIIFIDFAKGDVAGNDKFVQSIGARVLRLPGDVLPIGAFHLPDYSDDAIRLVAEEKREVFSSLFQGMGAKQQGRLVEAVRTSYAEARAGGEPAPDFEFVADQLNHLYQLDGIQPDTLTEAFRRLTAYRLFWSRGSGVQIAAPLFAQRWLVDIHELGGLREVTAFTLIEQLYREMRGLPDSQIDAKTGLRHIRSVLVIDEAQYYLKAKNRFLQGIIREGRSKGFAVMLLCQSPDDFEQPDFDYTEQLQFTYMLQCKTSPKAVTRLLGAGKDESKRLAAELSRMEPLHGVGRGAGGSGVSRFRIVPFFELIPQ